MLLLVVDRRVRRPVVHPALPANNHVPLQAPQHRAPHDGRPRVHRLHDLYGRARARVRRPLAVGRRRDGGDEVRLEAAVEVVALPEAADEDNARDHAALGAEVVDLALDEVAHLADDGLEDVLDLLGRHDEEARVEARFFVIGEAGEAKNGVRPGLLRRHDVWKAGLIRTGR